MNGSYYAFQLLGERMGMGNVLMYIFTVVQAVYMMAQLAVFLDSTSWVLAADTAERFMPKWMRKRNKNDRPIHSYVLTTGLTLFLLLLSGTLPDINAVFNWLLNLNGIVFPFKNCWLFLAFIDSKIDIEGYKFSPDGRKVILIKSLPYHESIKKNPEDLPLATGRVVTDLNYRHWDHYVESVAHPFVANVNGDKVDEGEDILKGEPYECPMAPFGGIEQLDWSKDSKNIAYTCRKKTGVDYAVSTDADIYLYNVSAKTTRNLCKPEGYKEPKIDPTKSMRNHVCLLL